MTAVAGLFHVGIPVFDLERAIAFFRDLFGFQVVAEMGPVSADSVVGVTGARLRAVLLDGPAGRVELLKGDQWPPADLPPRVAPTFHLAFEVTDLNGVLARVRALGYEVLSQQPWLAPGDHPIVPGMRVAYIEGPERLTVELVERTGASPA